MSKNEASEIYWGDVAMQITMEDKEFWNYFKFENCISKRFANPTLDHCIVVNALILSPFLHERDENKSFWKETEKFTNWIGFVEIKLNEIDLEFKGKFLNNKFQLICFEDLFIEAIN